MAKLLKLDSAQRVDPHNLEAEQSVLGAVLLEEDAISRALELLSPDGEDFYHPTNKIIFRAMVTLFEKNTPVDIITLTDRFKDSADLDGVGGVAYIGELIERTPTAANIAFYAKIVKGRALARKLIHASTDIINRGYECGEAIEEFVDEAENIIFKVAQDRVTKSYYALKDIIKDTFKTVEELYEKKSSITGIGTGFRDLDKMTSGFQDSDLIIIAGRPSMGKTAFALNIAEHVAVEDKLPVAVFSLEMSKEQLTQRMLASRARVDLSRIRNGRLKDEDWSKLTTAVGTLYDAPIYIDDTPAQTVLEIRAKARRWKNELDLKLIVIDYLQLMRGGSRKDNREQEISEISRSLKALAKDLDIPVVALSQLSRRTEQREGNKPQLADLRESGAIEQDADIVAFVYRESFYKPCDCPADLCSCGVRRSAQILVRKQRNGPTGDIDLTFLSELARFEDQTQVDYGEIHGEWVED